MQSAWQMALGKEAIFEIEKCLWATADELRARGAGGMFVEAARFARLHAKRADTV